MSCAGTEEDIQYINAKMDTHLSVCADCKDEGMIIDIRGTNGSGKSHIVHEILRRHPVTGGFVVEANGDTADVLHVEPLNLFILGDYDKVCGGCDGIPTQDLIEACVREFADKGTVLLEGLLVGHTFERWNRLAMDLQPIPYKFLFLDTPEQVCIDRVKARRLARGNDKPYDPKNLTKDWHQCRRVKERLEQAGRDVAWLRHESAPADVLRMVTPR